MKTIIIMAILLISVSVFAAERTFTINTKDNEVSSVNDVSVTMKEAKTYMDKSNHTLNSIDLKIDGILNAITELTKKLQWWGELRNQVLKEAEKVKLKESVQ